MCRERRFAPLSCPDAERSTLPRWPSSPVLPNLPMIVRCITKTGAVLPASAYDSKRGVALALERFDAVA